jgi:predicted TIM-barrel fold metal-dependent hydrolase
MRIDEERRQILISADGHCGADLWDYRPYLERSYQDEFDAWARSFRDPWNEVSAERPEDNRLGVASSATQLNWDSKQRLAHLDEQGIAAEVLFPNTVPPFYPTGVITAPGPRNREEYELRFAGIRAHNRWLADFCAEAPERRAGLAQIFLDDVEDAIAEVRWAKDAGLRGVVVPNDHVLRMANLYYPQYDDLWAVCAELELPVHRHASFPTESIFEGGQASELVSFVEIQFYLMRAIGHMILSSAFERHPNLVFITTEIQGAADVSGYLAKLDGLGRRKLAAGTPFYEHIKDALTELRRTPSEYFATNCYVAGPTHDLREAYYGGVPNLMWGADIPHAEGTSPYSLAALRVMLWDVPEEDIEALLGTRAAKVYDFESDALQTIADRIGPTMSEIKTQLEPGEYPRYPEDTCCSVFMQASAAS